MIVALVAMVVIGALLATTLGLLMGHRDQVYRQRRALQADLLVESALDRAAHRAMLEEGYRGETWEIAAPEDERNPWHATAEIAVAHGSAETPGEIAVTLVFHSDAEETKEDFFRVMRKKTIPFRSPTAETEKTAAPGE
jgi:type II secretory pathway pseudopilin PulG